MSNRTMNVFHYEECENQPEDFVCICDDIRDKLDQEQTDALIDDRMEAKHEEN